MAEPVVWVVDDEPMMRKSLSRLLKSAGMQSRTFGSAEDFLRAHDPEAPGCLIVDVRMDGISGLELQEELARQHISIPVIVISGYAEVPNVVRAVKSGAIDFLQKPFDDECLLLQVQKAMEIDRVRRAEDRKRAEITSRLATLTEREQEILELLAEGRSTKQIGSQLGISSKTADVHRARILEKMEASSVVELVRLVHALRT